VVSARIGSLLFLCALGTWTLGCGDTSEPPTSFGVNLTVSLGGIDPGSGGALARVLLHADGVEMADKTLNINDFKNGEARVRFIPTVRTGVVRFTATGFDAANVKRAFGKSGDLQLTPGAIAANIMLKKVGDAGAACTMTDECGSAGACVDGVCCTVASCPACRACGPTGMCDVVITRASDPGSCEGGNACDGNGVCCTSSCLPCHQCGTDGQCNVPITDAEDPGKCDDVNMCDASGACRLKNGQMCMNVMPDVCASGFCSRNTCCDTACAGPCRACDIVGQEGACQVASLVTVPGCDIDGTGARACDPGGDCAMPHLVADINKVISVATNTQPSDPSQFTLGPDGRVYFSASDGMNGRELWVTDGTAMGTRMVADLANGANSSFPQGLITVGNRLYFTGRDATNKKFLFRTDGTAQNTVPVVTTFTDVGDELVELNGQLFFVGDELNSGRELWKTDGSVAGTMQVKDIITTAGVGGIGNFVPSRLTRAGSQLFFVAGDQTTLVGANVVVGNFELWRSDGTAAGTALTNDLSPGNASTGFVSHAAVGSTFYFGANTSSGTVATELYKSDGTLNGTVLVKDIPTAGLLPLQLTAVGNRLFFTGDDGTSGNHGRELWVSDGTDAGTQMVRDIVTGAGAGNIQSLTAVGGTLFFTATDASLGTELWKSNGLLAGTNPVRDINPSSASSDPRQLGAFGSRLFFTTVSTPTRDLWVTDGTAAGTAKACQVGPGCAAFGFANMQMAGGRLWFGGSPPDGSIGAELYAFP
jgi:ELWxxDGT repeat protein